MTDTATPDPRSFEGGFHDYLGDGVYASFDGYQVWLAVNDHRNKVVALEPSVLDALYRYRQRLSQEIADRVIAATKSAGQ